MSGHANLRGATKTSKHRRQRLRRPPIHGGLKRRNQPGSIWEIAHSYDNALAKTIIGLYKAEVIYARGPWRTHDAVEYSTLEWVDWFNHRRLLESIGNVPPAEYEQAYYRLNESQPMAA